MHNNIYSEKVVIEILIEVSKSSSISGGFRGGGGGQGVHGPLDFFCFGHICLHWAILF